MSWSRNKSKTWVVLLYLWVGVIIYAFPVAWACLSTHPLPLKGMNGPNFPAEVAILALMFAVAVGVSLPSLRRRDGLMWLSGFLMAVFLMLLFKSPAYATWGGCAGGMLLQYGRSLRPDSAWR